MTIFLTILISDLIYAALRATRHYTALDFYQPVPIYCHAPLYETATTLFT